MIYIDIYLIVECIQVLFHIYFNGGLLPIVLYSLIYHSWFRTITGIIKQYVYIWPQLIIIDKYSKICNIATLSKKIQKGLQMLNGIIKCLRISILYGGYPHGVFRISSLSHLTVLTLTLRCYYHGDKRRKTQLFVLQRRSTEYTVQKEDRGKNSENHA